MVTVLVSIMVGFIELIVGLRFVLRLLGANPDTTFVGWIYDISSPFIAPFLGIFGQPAAITRGAVVQSVFEPSTLTALIVYAIIGGVVLQLLRWRMRPRHAHYANDEEEIIS